MAECKHRWYIFKDSALYNSGYLSFFCAECLALRKVQKKYEE